MKKFATLTAMFFAMVLLATPAFAQEKAAYSLIDLTPYFGAALTTLGAALGIGKLAGSALESMARQPEAAGGIQTAMIIAAALIEGFTFFALYICYVGATKVAG